MFSNLDPKRGLMNGVLVEVQQCWTAAIAVIVRSGPSDGQLAIVPKIKFVDENWPGFRFVRHQVP